jgi:hypothetical protein
MKHIILDSLKPFLNKKKEVKMMSIGKCSVCGKIDTGCLIVTEIKEEENNLYSFQNLKNVCPDCYKQRYNKKSINKKLFFKRFKEDSSKIIKEYEDKIQQLKTSLNKVEKRQAKIKKELKEAKAKKGINEWHKQVIDQAPYDNLVLEYRVNDGYILSFGNEVKMNSYWQFIDKNPKLEYSAKS